MNSDQIAPNDFQIRVEQRLSAVLSDIGRTVDNRKVQRVEPTFYSRQPEIVVFIVASDLKVWIHENTVSFEVSGKGDYYEMPDYQSADALADAFLTALTTRLREPGQG